MSLRAISIAMALACGASDATADRAIAVDAPPALPFAASELVAALRLRLDPAGPAVRVVVTGGPGGVVVTTRGASRTVPLGDRTGSDAARLVALAISDLLLEELPAMPVVEQAVVEPPSAPPSAAATSITVVATSAVWSGILAGAGADLAIPRDRWIATLDVGGGALVDGGLQLRGAVLRAGGGICVDNFELRAGATVAGIDVEDGIGDRTILAGANASARLRLPLGPRTRFVVALGADAFATRTEYRMSGRTIATPWLAPWLASGIEMTP